MGRNFLFTQTNEKNILRKIIKKGISVKFHIKEHTR